MILSGIFSILVIIPIVIVLIGAAILLVIHGTALIVNVVGRVFGFIGGVLADIVRCLLSGVGLLVSAPLAIGLLVLGRWGSANRMARWFGDSAAGLARHPLNAVIVRPLRLVFLDSVADTVFDSLPGSGRLVTVDAESPEPTDQRVVPEALVKGGEVEFAEFTIVRELKGGGSGARLYVARPSSQRRKRLTGRPEEVVIKSFVLEQGSTLPSIIRESRALEGARRLGLVIEHHLDEGHFWYVMPYHAGDSLGETVRVMHEEGASSGLDGQSLRAGVSYVRDLVATLTHFHESGLWHKDVKPDNLIVHGGRAHLVDLGLVTSLQSSLTLTTHGTEYFRDPEMVRMALRGVKVHEVDGSKFDIYGAGAVLYYVLENDFPAHGGLSDFSRKVPDALSWIVRRAMTDYGKRYPSSRAFLDDLDTVLASEDLWSVRPAELPSMAGDSAMTSAPPPPLVRTMGERFAPPPRLEAHSVAGRIDRRAASTPRALRKAGTSNPRGPRRIVRPRPEVPTDRPSGLLIALGLTATLAIIIWAIGLLPTKSASVAEDFTRRASLVFGDEVGTLTLIDPVGSRRVLLITNEDLHRSSGVPAEVTERVVTCYLSSDFVLDPTSDLQTLGRLLPEQTPDQLCLGVSDHTSRRLKELGYSGVARVMSDEDGRLFLRYQNSANHLHVIPLLNEEDCFTIPESLEIQSAHERLGNERNAESGLTYASTTRRASAAAILDRHNPYGVDSCPRTREPISDRSWLQAPLPPRAPSMHLSLVPSPMPVSMRPTSRVVRPRMSQAIRMSA